MDFDYSFYTPLFQNTSLSEHFSVDVFISIYNLSIKNHQYKLSYLQVFSEGKIIDYIHHLIAENTL